ncbi:hypothetical protein GCM10022254_60180 [Actinomadura meridiana]|uniref:Uncharacterized protein n=1 Tax=Actinomadura meridiana TaxID=559626 RepID=A0ABP8CIS9_9ACTN
MAKQLGETGHAGASRASRSWWSQFLGFILTLVVIDALMLLVGPLLWAGGDWTGGALLLTLGMIVFVDLLFAIAVGATHFRRGR